MQVEAIYCQIVQIKPLCIDKSMRQDVFKLLSLEIKIYIVLKDKACLYLE